MEDSKIAIVDLETTSKEPQYTKIVEIGIVELDPICGTIETLFNQVVKEDGFNSLRDQYAWIFYNSTLTIDEVKNAKSLEYYRDEIQQILNRYPLTSYNTDFDLKVLRKKDFFIKKELPCVMKVATGILKIPSYTFGYKYPTLNEAWYFYKPQKTYFVAHRALDDAQKTAQILFEMINRGDYEPRVYEYKKDRYMCNIKVRDVE